jgi:hypothetical protein
VKQRGRSWHQVLYATLVEHEFMVRRERAHLLLRSQPIHAKPWMDRLSFVRWLGKRWLAYWRIFRTSSWAADLSALPDVIAHARVVGRSYGRLLRWRNSLQLVRTRFTPPEAMEALDTFAAGAVARFERASGQLWRQATRGIVKVRLSVSTYRLKDVRRVNAAFGALPAWFRKRLWE